MWSRAPRPVGGPRGLVLLVLQELLVPLASGCHDRRAVRPPQRAAESPPPRAPAAAPAQEWDLRDGILRADIERCDCLVHAPRELLALVEDDLSDDDEAWNALDARRGYLEGTFGSVPSDAGSSEHAVFWGDSNRVYLVLDGFDLRLLAVGGRYRFYGFVHGSGHKGLIPHLCVLAVKRAPSPR